MKRPELILFDYGETLVHEREINVLCGHEKLVSLAVNNPNRLTGAALFEAARGLSKRLKPSELEIEVPITHFNRILFDRFGLRFDRTDEELAEEFWNAAFVNEPVPGAEETLAALRARGIRYAVASNISLSGNSLRKLISGVLKNFDPEFVLASSDYLVRKPDPLFLEVAVARAVAPKDRIWFVGDKPHRDVAGAEAVGIFPLLYDPENAFPDCGAVKIRALPDLIGFVEKAE